MEATGGDAAPTWLRSAITAVAQGAAYMQAAPETEAGLLLLASTATLTPRPSLYEPWTPLDAW
jgi:hypothetical protein